MLTPYDWQESVGNRAQYIEGRLAHGAPVIAFSAKDGVVLLSYKRQVRKLFEIYDRLGFGAIGQQADIESIRVAALEFATKEGFQRSEQDVTIQRIVTAVSQPIKRAFGDFSSSPFVARCLFAEVNATPAEDMFSVIDFSGDYEMTTGYAIAAGDNDTHNKFVEKLNTVSSDANGADLVEELTRIWQEITTEEGEPKEALTLEAFLISRDESRENRFIPLA